MSFDVFNFPPLAAIECMDKAILEKELFRKLFESAPDPIIIVDQHGNIILTNTETTKKFGYEGAELVNQPLEMLLPERFRTSHVASRERYNTKPRRRPMGLGLELYARKKDGSEFPVEISLSPLSLSDSMMVISIIRDISERKLAEKKLMEKAEEAARVNAELERSNGELEQFAYIASHDLQEPLRSIAGSCQLLARRLDHNLDATSQELITFAVDGAKRMQELINDLLSYSRVTTKAKEPEWTSLNDVLTQVLSNLKTAVEDAQANVTHASLPVLKVDRYQIIQLFQNLIANALKFRRDHPPRVEITAQQEDGAWHFFVRDNGTGMDPKYFDRIFEVFKRLHTREEYPGTGIGLATCRKIVERHGGRIWVESELGKESTFHFTIPS